MMERKLCLSIDQMRKLKELGIETKDASMVLIFFTENSEELSWNQVENHGKEKPLWEWFNEEAEIWEPTIFELFDAETGNYDHSYREECGVFTLQDMLDLMPTYVYQTRLYDKQFSLGMEKFDDKYKFAYWSSLVDELMASTYQENAIDAAFELLCWLAENKLLK